MSNRLQLNFIWIATTFLSLIFCYISRIGLFQYITNEDYISIFSLAVIIFVFPDYLNKISKAPAKWYQSSDFFTILLLVAFTVVGLVFNGMFLFSMLEYALWIVAIALLAWLVKHTYTSISPTLLAIGVFSAFYIVIFIYSKLVHSPVFYEQVIRGFAERDTLSHASISNIFSVFGVSSTGVHGIETFKYHWGSHALFGGLKNVINLDSISFYNIAYPGIFIPLFLKIFLNFTHYFFDFKGQQSYSIIFLITTLAILFVTDLLGFQPIGWSESFNIAAIFLFAYLSALLIYIKNKTSENYWFYGFSIFACLIISSTKISTGFVIVPALMYLLLRTGENRIKYAVVLFSGLVISTFVLMYVAPLDRLVDSGANRGLKEYVFYLFNLAEVFWSRSPGGIGYFIGLIVIFVLLLNAGALNSFTDFKKNIVSKKVLDVEMLAVIMFFGFAGALYVASHSLDVFFFLSTQMYLAGMYIIYYVSDKFNVTGGSHRAKLLIMVAVMLMSMISNPGIIDTYTDIRSHQEGMQSLSGDKVIFRDLLQDLKTIDKQFDKKSTAIHIPLSEGWYYNSQSNGIMGSSFVVPAISGIPLIGGIPEQIYFADIHYYGFNVYKADKDILIYNIDEAQSVAAEMGFKTLYVFKEVDGKLSREVCQL